MLVNVSTHSLVQLEGASTLRHELQLTDIPSTPSKKRDQHNSPLLLLEHNASCLDSNSIQAGALEAAKHSTYSIVLLDAQKADSVSFRLGSMVPLHILIKENEG